MNERLKELIKQHDVDFTIDGMGYGEGNIESLAELIVEECVKQCWSVSELEHKGYVVSECSKRMRKRFGVE